MIWTYEMLVDKFIETKDAAKYEYTKAQLMQKPRLFFPGLKQYGAQHEWFKEGDEVCPELYFIPPPSIPKDRLTQWIMSIYYRLRLALSSKKTN